MSSSRKPKPGCFGSDIHQLLLAAEAGQKADILTYSSGHLGPRGLNQSQPHRGAKQSFWRTSQSQEETPNPLIQRQTHMKMLTQVKKKEMKESPSEFTTDLTLIESEVSRSRQDQATDRSSHADRRGGTSLPKIAPCSSNSLPVQLRPFFRKKSNSSLDLGGKQQFSSSQSDHQGLNNEAQVKAKQRFGRRVRAEQDLWPGVNVAEKHERKLQKELKKLSTQSWPSRDRLVVFSDVFDDVCEDLPVFGSILREIKTYYDLYVDHMMASQSSLRDTSPKASLYNYGDGKVREKELRDAEEEVIRLEQEARRALEENKRVRNESQSVPAIAGPEDSDMNNASLSGRQVLGIASGCSDTIQSKRLQLLNTWREIQQLEEELKEKSVSTVITTATERHIKDRKTEIMRLIALNDRMRTTNKDLENNINTVLDREKASKAIRRLLWDEIHLQTQREELHQQVNQETVS